MNLVAEPSQSLAKRWRSFAFPPVHRDAPGRQIDPCPRDAGQEGERCLDLANTSAATDAGD